ncbi:MAG: NnrU family protein [Pseudomonadota bacterium]
MTIFLAGLALFLGSHFFSALARGPRAALVARLGEGGYKGVYSLASLAGFVLIYMGWPDASRAVIYAPPYWLRHVAYLLVLIAFIFTAAAYVPAGRIAAAVKHPMLAGVKVWAFAHLLSNGDLRSVILFGGVLAFAVVDRIAVKRRDAPTPKAGPVTNDAIAVVVGLAGYAVTLLYLHPYIAGVALVAR